MRYLKHAVASLVIFAILTGLVVSFYDGIVDSYGIVEGDQKTITNTHNNQTHTGNIMEQFKEMNLIEGVQEINNAWLDLTSGSSSLLDIAGALLSLGIGAVKSVLGLLSAPYAISSIVLTYYLGEIPGVIGGLVVLVTVYAVFIIAGLYLRQEI